jgi:hypothetical protein
MADPDLADRYLELVKRSLAGLAHERSYALRAWEFEGRRRRWGGRAARALAGAAGRASGQALTVVREVDAAAPAGAWPLAGETMIGRERLDHLQACVETVLRDGVPGDLIEAGVWRGGAAILMRAVLAAAQVRDRVVWLADSFSGPPAGRPGPDRKLRLDRYPELAVSRREVERAFERYGLLDDQVRFHAGWFEESLPLLRGQRWALVRIDADLHASTAEALRNLYPSLEPGGYLIVDDYGVLEPCRLAVDEFRQQLGIREPLERVDASAVFWRRA